MRKIFILLLSLSSLTLCAQIGDSSEEYYFETIGQKYYLALNKDGTFLFSQYWKYSHGPDSSGSEHGKGTWALKNGTVRFYAETGSDIGQNHRLNLNNTIAIIKNKSRLIFSKSEIFWLENLKMEKRL